MLTSAQTDILRLMVDTEEELVAEGLVVWVGERRSSRGTLKALLRCCAIKDVSDVKGLQRFAANDAASAILRRPELADEIEAAVMRRLTFTIRADQVVLT